MHILWLKTELLHPVDKGGRIRTYNMLRALNEMHRVTYLTLDDGTAAQDAFVRAKEYSARVERIPFRPVDKGSWRFWGALAQNIVSPLPYAVSRYRSPTFKDRIRAILHSEPVDVIVCDFLAPAVNLPNDLPCRTVLFEHNVEAEIWRRHAAVATNPLRKAYFVMQWQRMRRFEAATCRRVDRVIAVSEKDVRHFREAYGVNDVYSIPTGVDIEFFRPLEATRRRPHSLVFTGSMDWMPNVDGIVFFVNEVMPLLRKSVPDLTLTVVGRFPGDAVRRLASDHPDVHVTGTVPDVRPYLAKASAFVVPLRIGGGTRLKIYEAMAMEVPVVSTHIGAEGLPVRAGEHLLLGDSPAALAEACARLLLEPEVAATMAENAAQYVRENFGWSQIAGRFAALCAEPRPTAPAIEERNG